MRVAPLIGLVRPALCRQVGSLSKKPAQTDHLRQYLNRLSKSTDMSSAVFRGTTYEYVVADMLANVFKCSSVAVSGRSGDGGVDINARLLGPHQIQGIDVLAQCKNISKKAGPQIFRELSGVVSRYWNPDAPDVLSILASTSDASRDAGNWLLGEATAMIYCRVMYDEPKYDSAHRIFRCKLAERNRTLVKMQMNTAARNLLEKHGIRFISVQDKHGQHVTYRRVDLRSQLSPGTEPNARSRKRSTPRKQNIMSQSPASV